MPTAANASVASLSILPTMAVSVIDSKGSAIPAIKAGKASLLICLKVTLGFDSINLVVFAKCEFREKVIYIAA